MNFIQKTRFQFLTIGLFLITLLFSQCKPINQTGSGHQISAAKQEAMAKIFDDAKIIKQYQWKDYLEIHPHLIGKFNSLNISNGFFYDITKPGSDPITVALSKGALIILNNEIYASKYNSRFVDLSEIDFSSVKMPTILPVSFICENDECINLFSLEKSECFNCNGTGKSPIDLFEILEILSA